MKEQEIRKNLNFCNGCIILSHKMSMAHHEIRKTDINETYCVTKAFLNFSRRNASPRTSKRCVTSPL